MVFFIFSLRLARKPQSRNRASRPTKAQIPTKHHTRTNQASAPPAERKLSKSFFVIYTKRQTKVGFRLPLDVYDCRRIFNSPCKMTHFPTILIKRPSAPQRPSCQNHLRRTAKDIKKAAHSGLFDGDIFNYFLKHSLQYTGRSSRGWKGTWHSFPQAAQTASYI